MSPDFNMLPVPLVTSVTSSAIYRAVSISVGDICRHRPDESIKSKSHGIRISCHELTERCTSNKPDRFLSPGEKKEDHMYSSIVLFYYLIDPSANSNSRIGPALIRPCEKKVMGIEERTPIRS